MSMVCVSVAPDGVVFSCDGVSSNSSTGVVTSLVSKLHLFPEIDTIMGFTGLGKAGRFFAMGVEGRYQDFDDMLERVIPDLQEMHEGMTWNSRLFNHPNDKKMCVAIGGWSISRQRFEAYRVMSYEKGSTSYVDGEAGTIPAWTPHPIESGWASFVPSQENMEACGVEPETNDNMVDLGIRMICAGRCHSGPEPEPEADGHHVNVGGFVQVAVMTHSGINTWIAHRWAEDVIGEAVDPSRGPRLPPFLTEGEEEGASPEPIPEAAE